MDDKRTGRIYAVVEFSLLASIIALVVISISEIVARQQFLTFVTNQIGDIQSELVDSGASPDSSERIDILRQQVNVLKTIRAETESLVSIGASQEGYTLEYLRGQKSRSEERAREAVFGKLPTASSVHRTEESRAFLESARVRILSYILRPFSFLNSDILLALVVIGCGSIGAVIAGIRAENGLALKPFSLGLAAGFIAFLAIKGGRYLFLISADASVIDFNPYSSAFVGILVGMFTERAYDVLSNLVDELIKRMTG